MVLGLETTKNINFIIILSLIGCNRSAFLLTSNHVICPHTTTVNPLIIMMPAVIALLVATLFLATCDLNIQLTYDHEYITSCNFSFTVWTTHTKSMNIYHFLTQLNCSSPHCHHTNNTRDTLLSLSKTWASCMHSAQRENISVA